MISDKDTFFYFFVQNHFTLYLFRHRESRNPEPGSTHRDQRDFIQAIGLAGVFIGQNSSQAVFVDLPFRD